MKKYASYVMTVMGLVLLCVGLLLVKTLHEPQGILKTLPYIIVGLGCGAFGCGAGNALSQRTVRKHPEIQKQMEIDANDERNTAIANRAKAKAYDMMVFVFGALILAFAIINVNVAATLLTVFAYLIVIGIGIYYRVKYEKEM